jgi:pyruvate formate lyase activating enzyme
MSGVVFDIQRFSVDDGPGVRTTVFFKGCPLRCKWCHNPESQSKERCVAYYEQKCLHCGACAQLCDCHSVKDGEHTLDRTRCLRCGKCVEACFNGALELLGEEMTAEQVLAEVCKDEVFYRNSGGGVTFSGGEPLMQPDFLMELLQLSKQRGLHTCIETCGFAPPSVLRRVAPLVDLFLFDLKETDAQRHLELTGAPLAPILSNLQLLQELGASVILRCPMIPTVNDRQEHLDAIAALASGMENVLSVEVMAYHTLGISKYRALDMDYDLSDLPPMSDDEKKRLTAYIAKRAGKPCGEDNG